jgi:hypothetical protein
LPSVPLAASTAPSPLALSRRDRRIIDLALAKVRGANVDFAEALRALQESAAELITGGRLFFLGATDTGPIVGSILSGVGIVSTNAGIQLVRVHASGNRTLGWFAR